MFTRNRTTMSANLRLYMRKSSLDRRPHLTCVLRGVALVTTLDNSALAELAACTERGPRGGWG